MSNTALWISRQFGFDPVRTIRALRALPRFLAQLRQFYAVYDGPRGLQPCLHDYATSSGDTTSEYFLQDLYVAQRVFAANPRRHLDVGSHVDGFVAHVASFRQIDVLDIRPNRSEILGIRFYQADLSGAIEARCDSISCLHALEHFGLGRYGDSIDPDAASRGLSTLAAMLEPGGRLYLSVPVGRPRVIFNAHRIFDPESLRRNAADEGLCLTAFAYVEDGSLRESAMPVRDLARLSQQPYALGIFTFDKE